MDFINLEIDEFEFGGKLYSALVDVYAEYVDNGFGTYEYGSIKGVHVDIQLEVYIEDVKLKEYNEDNHEFYAINFIYNSEMISKIEDIIFDHVKMLIDSEMENN